jgi:two-component system, LytTR family, sensor kinase
MVRILVGMGQKLRLNPQSPVVRFTGLLLVWTLFGTLGYTRYYLQQRELKVPIDFWPQFFAWLACYWVWVPLSALVVRLERKFPIGILSWRGSLPVLAIASVVFSYSAYLFTLALAFLIRAIEHRPSTTPRPVWPIPGGEFCIEEFFFWSVIAAAYVVRKLSQLRERERETALFALEKARLEATLRTAELETLRMRLNPHFLFNSLQNISVLAQQDPRMASRMLTRLGDLLRSAFQGNLKSEITLEEEIGLTRAYTDIEKMRFGERLCVELDIAPDTRAALVPSLLLQPLVENAIIHGLAGMKGQGRICIRSVADDRRLTLSVSDNGTGFVDSGRQDFEKGVGLGSTYERLRRMYPDDHEITVNPGPDGGTEVRIVLPFRMPPYARVIQDESHAFADRGR